MKMKVMIDDQAYIADVEDIHTRPVVARSLKGNAMRFGQKKCKTWPQSRCNQVSSLLRARTLNDG